VGVPYVGYVKQLILFEELKIVYKS
jgi:hypothetical protein